MFRKKFRKFATKFDDELKFFKHWVAEPKKTGSITPTSSITSQRMASIINLDSGLPVLEVGPGTGVITRAILARGVKPSNLYVIEYSHNFVLHLKEHYKDINIIEGDAFNVKNTLKDYNNIMFDCIISSVPLLNFSMQERVKYIEGLLECVPEGRPVIQITYGLRPPVLPGHGNYSVKHLHFIIRNIPPARIWVYQKGKNN